MARHVSLRELLVGTEGLAVVRHLYEGSDADAARRLAELRRVLDAPGLDAAEETSERDARTGYAAWAESYDGPGNQIVALEETVVHALIDATPPGRALDAACGTGRHARRLADRGHRVSGFDLSAEMLERARTAVPDATFWVADLREIAAGDGAFDLIVCGLALAHLPDLGPPLAELARVLAPGGRLVVSALHPFLALLGWHAPFTDSHGRRGFVREHAHRHADYLAASSAAGLTVRGLYEPVLGPEGVAAKRRAYRHLPEATSEAYLGVPAVVVWDLSPAASR